MEGERELEREGDKEGRRKGGVREREKEYETCFPKVPSTSPSH
jgi:hypothetical protein